MSTATLSRTTVRAAGTGELDLVAQVRARCYTTRYAEERVGAERIAHDRGDVGAGDMLLAERDGRAVGTATCLSGEMGVRGVAMPAQGVAWVGTVHDARRGGKSGEPGVASLVMKRVLEVARDRGEVVSALMPFRASFYEHFGYGLAERRAVWDIPTPLLPRGEFDGIELFEPDDAQTRSDIADLRCQTVRASHGDLEWPQRHDGFNHWVPHLTEQGWCYVDRDPATQAVRGFLSTQPLREGGRLGLLCTFTLFRAPADFARQLRLLASLKDQYGSVQLAAPADWPVNLLLGETQIPHRPVEHPHATCKVVARMQVRVLDHRRFFEDALWPDAMARGGVSVSIVEPEGHTARLRLDVADGRCAIGDATGEPDFACNAVTWAAVAMGEMKASTAVQLGLATASPGPAIELLNTLTHGPLPFCRDYF